MIMKNFIKTGLVLALLTFYSATFAQSPFEGIVVNEVENNTGSFANGEKTYRVYVELNSGKLLQVFADETRPLNITTSTEFFNMGVFGSIVNFQNEANPGAFPFIPSHEFDSWLTFGDSYTESAPSVVGDVGLSDNLEGSSWSFGGTINSDASIFRTPDNVLTQPVNGLILIAQFTTNGILSGTLNFAGVDDNNNPWEATQVTFTTAPVYGCSDPTACNFNSQVTVDDGSCFYSVTSNISVESCGDYDWYGQTYSASGTYTYVNAVADGCDSIINLELTVFPIDDCGNCIDGTNFTDSCEEFQPEISIELSSIECLSTSDIIFNVSQTANQPDMSTSLLTTDVGYFDFSGVEIGQIVGSANIVAAGNDLSFESSLVVSSIISANEIALSSINNDDSSVMGTFNISNSENGIIILINSSYQDGNNVTAGNTSSIYLNGLFVIPNVDSITFNTSVNSETGSADVQSFLIPVTCPDFNPEISLQLSNLICNTTTDITFNVSQSANQADMGTSMLTSDAGYFDFSNLEVGQNVGSAVLVAAGDEVNFEANLIVSSIVSDNEIIISAQNVINGTDMVTFSISNQNDGGILMMINNTYDDGNIVTAGNSTTITLEGLFVNPDEGDLNFSTSVNSETGDVDSQTLINVITCPEFNPVISLTLSTLDCNTTSDITFVVSQSANQADMSTSMLTSDAGYFDFSGLEVGQNVGSAVLVAAGDEVNFEANMIVSSFVSDDEIIISALNVINGITMGSFSVSNQSDGGVLMMINSSYDDGNNVTAGNSTTIILNGLFVNPDEGDLNFNTSVNSELGDVDSQTLLNVITCPCFDATYNEFVEICQNETYTFDGNEYSVSGIYSHNYETSLGCDSIVLLNLTVNPNTSSTTTISTCQPYLWNNQVYFESGTYTFETTNVNGCDSTAVLELTIQESSSSNTSVNACESYEWNGEIYSQDGTYYFFTSNVNGCDSLAVLNLTINQSTSSSSSISSCNSYEWNRVTYTESGVYTFETVNANGCDSVATLDLTILEPTSSFSAVSVCESFDWNGETYTESGTYTFETVNSNGCDSITTLELIILEPSTSSISISACQGYFWNGQAYTQSGSYEYITSNTNGCDSTAILELTILESSSSSTTITACESYFWNDEVYTESGQYTFLTTNSVGCDSIASLDLTIYQTTNSFNAVSACESFDWNGETYTESGTYTFETTNVNGCDSTANLELTILEPSFSSSSISSCESFDWNGEIYTESGIYTYETVNVNGCDSIATLNLTIHQSNSSTSIVSSCDSYFWNGQVFTESGTYTFETTNINGCDSVAILELTIQGFTSSTTSVVECDSYTWNGETYNSSGTYFYNTENVNGCDSVATLLLTILPSTNSFSSISACESFDWNGETYTESGVYTFETLNAIGCDSVATLELTILESTSSTTSISACESFDWNGETYTESGVYTFETLNANGCDSVATLELTILELTNSYTTASSCFSYEWNGLIYTESGVYTYETTNADGCDSIATLELTIYESTASTFSISICDSYEWNGNLYSESGTYHFYTTNVNGCDSTATLELTILESTSSFSSVSVCESFDWNGETYTESGVYTFETLNANGCDSVATLDLTINQPTTSYYSVSACESFDWNGETYTESGIYTFETLNANGCDSIATLDLVIYPSNFSTNNISVCGSYFWNGNLYTSSGTYTYETVNVNGCDSVATLELTIFEPTNSYTILSICDSFDWNGETYTESGVYTFETVNVNGCDSVATLELTILESTSSTTSISVCESFDWNGETYTESGVYTFETLNSNGCDSVATLELTILESTSSTTSISVCESFDWNGETYTESGVYTFETLNANGCDSIASLELTILELTNSYTTASSCFSYEWNGEIYTVSGTYSYETTNANGCDSIATLELSIHQPTSSIHLVTECDSYEWNGQLYSESGTYYFNTINTNGCDSIATLELTILESSYSTDEVSSCDSFDWNGETYTESGVYTFETLNVYGCDSVATIELTILESTSSTTSISVCESFDWNGETYTESGVYTFETLNANGCDSVATLELTILESTSSTTSISVCESFDWNGETYTESGVYTFETLNANGCDSVATLELTILESTSSTTSISVCESFDWNGETYTESGVYTFETLNANGCDSIATLELTILESSYSTDEVSSCESFDWNGETYTESGVYTFITQNANGCDSIATLNLTINVPSEITGLELDDLVDLSATISWDNILGATYFYRLFDGNEWSEYVQTTESEISILNLQSLTSYTFEIYSVVNDCQSSVYEINFETEYFCPTPQSVVLTATPFDVTCSWEAVNGFSSYEVLYYVTGGAWQSVITDQPELTIEHLGFGLGYFYVRTVCDEPYNSDWTSLQYIAFPSCSIQLTASSIDASCVDGDGVITLEVSGAFGEYTIDTGSVDLNNVSAGTYEFTVEDDYGCTSSTNVVVEQDSSPEISLDLSDESICVGEQSTLTASGGFELYQWYNSSDEIIEGASSSTFTTNEPGEYYVISSNDFGCSVISSTITLTQLTVDAPSSIVNNYLSTTEANFTWENTSPQNLYNVSYSDDQVNWIEINNLSGNSLLLESLTSNTTYTFVVVAINGDCFSESSTITFTTSAECYPPTGIELTADPLNISVSWNHFAGAQSYELLYYTSGSGWEFLTVSNNSVTFPHGGGGIAYVYIRSICGEGYVSSWSELNYQSIPSCDIEIDAVVTDTDCADNNGSIELTVSGAYGEYTIDTGDFDLSSISSGTYSITATDEANCSQTIEVNVGQEEVASVTLSTSDNSLCSGEQTTLIATIGFDSYELFVEDGTSYGTQESNAFIISSENTYYVEATNELGCVSISNELEIQSVTILAPSTFENNYLSSTEANIYWELNSPQNLYNVRYTSDGVNWIEENNYTGNSILLNSLTPNTTYTFEVSSISGDCVSDAASFTFTTLVVCQAPSNIVLDADPLNVHIGWDSYANAFEYEVLYYLSGSGWNSLTTSDASISFSHNGYGVVYIYVRSICGDDYNSDWSSLSYAYVPQCGISVDADVTDASCSDGDGIISLEVNGAYGDYTIDAGGLDLDAVSSGTYSITVTDATNCSSTISVEVGLEELTQVTIEVDDEDICSGEVATLTASSGYSSYQWYDGDDTAIFGATSSTFEASESGDYYVVAGNDASCTSESSSISVSVLVVQAPTEIENNYLTTTEANIFWTQTSPQNLYNVRYSSDGVNWIEDDNYTGNSILLNSLTPNTTYTIEVIAISESCVSEATSLTFTTLMDCQAPSNISLTADVVNLYLSWDSYSNSSEYEILYYISGSGWELSTVEENSATIEHNGYGIAYVYVRSICGDGYTSEWSSLSYIYVPSCSISVSASTTNASCADGDGSVELSVSNPYGDYVIDAGGLDLSSISSGTYTVSVTDDAGCTASTTFTIDQDADPSISVSIDSDLLCEGESATLTALSGFDSYQWYDETGSLIEGATSNTFVTSSEGQYHVVAVLSGCLATSNPVEIQSITILAPSTFENNYLSSTEANIYWELNSPQNLYNVRYTSDGVNWIEENNYTGNSILLNSLTPNTTYTFEVSSISGDCVSDAASFTFTTLVDCQAPSNIVLDADPLNVHIGWDSNASALEYEVLYYLSGSGWNSLTTSDASISFSHNGYGVVYIYVRSICGDDYNSDWSSLSYAYVPQCGISVDADVTDASCSDGDGIISLEVNGAYGDYTIDAGGLDLDAVSSGTYSITVTDATNCSSTISVEVGLEELTQVTIEVDDEDICSGEVATLTASSGYSSYQWYDGDDTAIFGATSSTFEASESGDYYVVAGNDASCTSESSSISVSVLVVQAPTEIENNYLTTTEANIFWTQTSPQNLYNVRYSSDGVNWIEDDNYTGNSILLNSLTPNTTYTIEVIAISESCVSEATSLTFTTLMDCQAPSNISLTADVVNLYLSWDSYSNSSEYEILYYISGSGWELSTVEENSATIEHNGYGIAYVYVRSICGDGYTSEWSSLSYIYVPSCSISVSASTTNASCADGDGSVELSVSGAYGEYTINTGGYDINALSAGTYSITVTDDADCSASINVVVGQESPENIEISTTSNQLCLNNQPILSTTSVMASYQWYNSDDEAVDGATSNQFSPSEGGAFYVVGISSSGCESTSNSILIESIELPVPTGLSTTYVTETGANFVWDNVSPTGQYYFRYSSDGINWIEQDNYNGTSSPISGLTSGITYTFEISSVDGDCISASATLEITTLQECITPTVVSLTSNNTDIIFTWESESYAEDYEVMYYISGSGWNFSTVSDDTFTVSHNGYGVGYFYVRSLCPGGEASAWSALTYVFNSSSARIAQELVPLTSNVYPNPSNGIVNVLVNTNQNQEYTISITDSYGKLVFVQDQVATSMEIKTTIDMSSYANGIYYIQVVSGEEVVNQKLILQ